MLSFKLMLQRASIAVSSHRFGGAATYNSTTTTPALCLRPRRDVPRLRRDRALCPRCALLNMLTVET